MKKIEYKILLVFILLSNFIYSEELSSFVTENNLYKPSRIKKHIDSNKYFERNIVNKKKYLEEKEKEKKFKTELLELKKNKRKKEVRKREVNSIQKKEKKLKYRKLMYLNQDTPMERIATFYEKDKNSLYKELILYLINDKQIGSLEEIEAILNSRDGYLSFYEAIVKTFYQGYFEGKYNKNLLRQMNLIYEKGYIKIKDTYIGLLLQDLFLSMGLIHIKDPLISSISYCYTLEGKRKQFACKMNQVQIICLSGDDKMCNIYKTKMKFEYKEAERYLNNDLKLLKNINEKRKKEFESKQKK